MSFIKRLLGKAGIISVAAPAAGGDAETSHDAPTVPLFERRTVTLDHLLSEDRAQRAERQEAVQAASLGLTAEFAAIFAAAGVETPAHGWTIERAAELMAGAEYRSADREERHRALTIQLAIEKVPPEDLLRDATARDQAVDAYELFLKAKVAELTHDLGDEERRLREELHTIETRLARVATDRAGFDQTLEDWRRRKREREVCWAETLALLTPDGSLDPTWVSVSDEE